MKNIPVETQAKEVVDAVDRELFRLSTDVLPIIRSTEFSAPEQMVIRPKEQKRPKPDKGNNLLETF